MLKLLINFIISPNKIFNKINQRRLNNKNLVAMAGEGVKTKSDMNLEQLPVKKMKLNSDVQSRTVATMCGAWRPEEEDGGLIFVFKTRKECLSPDPTRECDYPENIEDFWEASLMANDDNQFPENKKCLSKCTKWRLTEECNLPETTDDVKITIDLANESRDRVIRDAQLLNELNELK